MVKQKKNNKTLVVSIIILVFAILIIIGLSYTGQIIKTKEKVTKLDISSKKTIVKEENLVLKPGDMLYVTVETGYKGSNNRVYLYKISDVKKRRATNIVLRKCPNICLSGKVSDGEFRIPLDWSGKYCAAIIDLGTNKEVESCFNVKK